MKNQYGKILSAIILTILAACLNASAQTQQPKFLIINGLKEDVKYILSGKTLKEMQEQPGGISGYDIRAMESNKARAEKAQQKIKQLLDSGTAESEMIELADSKMTLGELSERVFTIHREATQVVLMSELYQAGMGASAWLGPLGSGKKLDSGDLSAVKVYGEKLRDAVKEAQKFGFPEDYKDNINGQDYTLAQLKEMAEYVLTAGDERAKAYYAERAAKDAPFLKVLTGDKARIFKQEFGGNGGQWLCLGVGGGALTTPEQMKGASVWFTYGNNRGLVDTWHITGFRFQGDKLVGRISKSGYGLKPSAADFK